MISVDWTKDIRLIASASTCWAILQTLKVALITNESYYSKIQIYCHKMSVPHCNLDKLENNVWMCTSVKTQNSAML